MTRPVLAIFRYSIRKIMLDRRWLLTLAMALMVAGIMGYAGSRGMTADEGATLMDLLILSFVMPVMAMIHGSSLMRNEIDDGSITQVITAPLDRRIAYVGYYAALAASLSLFMLVINAAGWAAFYAQAGLGGGAASVLGVMVLVSIAGSLAYSALFLAVGVFTSKPVFFGLFYTFVWETFVGSIPGAISKYTVKHFVRSLGSAWLDMGDLAAYDGSSAAASVAVLATLTGFLLVLGASVFREKEFP